MEVEISKEASVETPASSMTKELVEHLTSIMVMCGIEGISVSKYDCGLGSKLNVTMAPFNDIPEEVYNQGVVVKDAIAQIMSIANITRLLAKPSDVDMNELKKSWNMAAEMAKSENSGSAQDFGKQAD